MSFGLKNAGATYQRMVNSIFKEQIGRNMEIYLDDMLVKSKVGDRSLPFFKKIKQESKEPFVWDGECTKVFAELKEYLGSTKLLTRLEEGEDLQLYLAISDGAVRSVLVREGEGAQKHIYYGLRESKIEEVPRWKLYVHGASNEKGYGAEILIKGPEGEVFEYGLRFSFKATNNEAEYEAMVTGLEIAQTLKIKRLLVQGDSKLVIDQIRGDCGVKNEKLGKYHAKALSLLPRFDYVVFEHIPRGQKKHADHLSHLATTYFEDIPKGVHVEVRDNPIHMEHRVSLF
ncbi:hypothetical protein LIER_18343 [Lithospermum erythrorhizon]|uniref:RNase H type-1 domain-containing protein n=1 Tax=Lithospermum erythrorhizon TaxID=34254 RepID=A0AAV3QGT7_LITER